MKTISFYNQTADVISRIKSNIVSGITDKRFLELEIAKWLSSAERHRQIEGDAYYNGQQEIIMRKRMVIGENGGLEEAANLPNNRIVDNQYAKMVDQKANYLCGQPVTFDVKNKEYGKLLSRIFGKKKQRIIRICAEKALTEGKAWICPYYNSAGEFTFTMLPAHEVLPFWTDEAHTELELAVHLFRVYVYDEKGNRDIVTKAEIFHGGGIERCILDGGTLIPDNDAVSGPYAAVTDPNTGETSPLNWSRIPLVCFKSNHREIPLLCRVKCLQDALNLLLSNYVNAMEETVHNTILVIQNYDGENLGQFRRNLSAYNAVKVRSFDGTNGGVSTLKIEVNAENYKTIIELLKKAIIENARGYDAKDERMGGTPNQMNIRSMYSDIDLDANGMETEFQAAFEDLLWFVNAHLANTGEGDFENEDVTVIFNRDILVNESETIDNIGKSMGILSTETLTKQHPWVDNPEEELRRMDAERSAAKEEAMADDPYRRSFEATAPDKTADE